MILHHYTIHVVATLLENNGFYIENNGIIIRSPVFPVTGALLITSVVTREMIGCQCRGAAFVAPLAVKRSQ